MIDTSDFFKGMKIEIEGEPYIILEFQNARTAQRRSNVTVKMKHLISGQVLEKVFSSGERFEEPPFETKTMQFLYNDGEHFNFMDTATYDQIALTIEAVGDNKWYLLENHEYAILFFKGSAINIELPTSVVLTVVESEPAVKGDRVSNVLKAAKLETGLEVKVPIFVKEGDKVKVDTRDGKYLERM